MYSPQRGRATSSGPTFLFRIVLLSPKLIEIIRSHRSAYLSNLTLLFPLTPLNMASKGASGNERLLAAAKSDNEDLLVEVFEGEEPFDINHQDGLGNTALHYAVLHASFNVLEDILSEEGCDVDLTNKLEGATPLHLAVLTEEPEDRAHLVESLLEAGADYRIPDKHGEKALDLVKQSDEDVLALFRKAQAEASIDNGDIAHDDDDDVASDGSD